MFQQHGVSAFISELRFNWNGLVESRIGLGTSTLRDQTIGFAILHIGHFCIQSEDNYAYNQRTFCKM